MSISFSRYIDITSVVGASNVVPERQYIARLFTDNPLLPPQSFIQFTTAAEVGSYFGTNSNEYLRALFYFSFISKSGTTPQLISFDRWVDVAQAPMILGLAGGANYLNFTTITNGTFGLIINGTHFNLSGINFSAVTSLGEVAALVQGAINAEVGGGAMWTSATVNYNPANGGSFVFTGGQAIAATISVVPGTGGTDISGVNGSGLPLLNWYPAASFLQGNFIPGAIWAEGSLVEDPALHVSISASVSNNFGSFAFITSTPLTLAQNIEVATWNATQNVTFIFNIPVIAANATAWANDATGLGTINGTALTLNVDPISELVQLNSSVTVSGFTTTSNLAVGMQVSGTGIPNATVIASIPNTTSITLSNAATVSSLETLSFYPIQFPEMLPMAIQAATNYNGTNTVQNYEFQQAAGLTPTVVTDTEANDYDAEFINYYGQTQTAGQLLSFYQTGVMLGLPSSPGTFSIYANEIWLRDAIGAAIMSLFLSLNEVPANVTGAAQLNTIIQSVINQALLNGTISVGKPLDANQQLFITQVTGNPNAWYQVQNSGYWLSVQIVIIPDSSPLKYQAVYTLVYSKNDVINKVVGTHDLI